MPGSSVSIQWKASPVCTRKSVESQSMAWFNLLMRPVSFDLDNDVSEQNDLVDEMPGRVREMHELLKRWRSEVDAKLPTPNPRFGDDSSRP